jgi:hypothetical protein
MVRIAKVKLFAAMASVLLPVLAPGESHMATEPHSASQLPVATVHVLFKIVIPEELSMKIDDERAGEPGMTISGNDRKETALSIPGNDTASHRVMLSAVGHRSIVRFATCLRSETAQSVPALSCTVSMP